MKKNYLTLIMLLFLAGAASAQITITQADLPVAGLAYTLAGDDTYSAPIPAGGASQSWNYAGLNSLFLDTTAFIPAAGTPNAAMFPTANLASYDPNGGSYSYFITNANGFYSAGASDSSLPGGSLIFSPPYLYVPTPFTYNNTVNSTARAQLDFSVYDSTTMTTYNFRIRHNVQSSFFCDGWGSLTLPNATYNNTLRVRLTEHNYDSLLVDLFGIGVYSLVSVDSSTSLSYRWVGHGPALYLLGLETDSTGTMAISSEYLNNYLLLGTQPVPSVRAAVSAYPNPAVKNVRISWGATFDAVSLSLYTTSGQQVMASEIENLQQLDVPVGHLAPGLYMYRLTGRDGSRASGHLVVAPH
jgi:hypothetical protein